MSSFLNIKGHYLHSHAAIDDDDDDVSMKKLFVRQSTQNRFKLES